MVIHIWCGCHNSGMSTGVAGLDYISTWLNIHKPCYISMEIKGEAKEYVDLFSALDMTMAKGYNKNDGK